MTTRSDPKDLVILAADRDTEAGVTAILSRTRSLGIRQVRYDSFVHVERDPGCRQRASEFLRPMARRYLHALVFFDREGSGAEQKTREELEQELESQLSASGWGNRAAVVVIDPELETWVWSESPNVASALGWPDSGPMLRSWMVAQELLPRGEIKPTRPKEALERVLREARTPRSPALYDELARQVNLSKCTDAAFCKLRHVLKEWFGT